MTRILFLLILLLCWGACPSGNGGSCTCKCKYCELGSCCGSHSSGCHSHES
jgi:hypothetical protein